MVSRQMKLLQMIETTGPGGAETVMLSIVRGLDPSQFDSLVVVTGKGWLLEQLQRHNARVVVIPDRGSFDWRFVLRALQLVHSEQVDLIHSHLDGMNFYATLVGILSFRPVIVTYHGVIEGWDRRSFRNRLKNFIIRHFARRIVVVSDYLSRQLSAVWRLPQRKLTRIYNGVDFSSLEVSENREAIKEELGIPPGSVVIGAVGNIRPAKGYEHFLDAAKLVVDSVPNARFVIVGEGKGKLLQSLKEKIAALALGEYVMMTGFRSDIPRLLLAMDIFVLSSTTEGLSIATIEAMAMSKPVVVTDCGGPTEIVTDGQTGFVVPVGEPEAMAERIIQLVNNGNLAQELGRRAQEEVHRRFSLQRNIVEYERLYKSILHR